MKAEKRDSPSCGAQLGDLNGVEPNSDDQIFLSLLFNNGQHEIENWELVMSKCQMACEKGYPAIWGTLGELP